MSECKDCLGSVQLQQGPAGPQGSQGETGLQGPQGPQGPAGADSTVAGPQGADGAVLLDTIVGALSTDQPTYTNVVTQTAPADTLDSNKDTLVFEGLVMSSVKEGHTVGIQIEVGGTVAEIGFSSGLFGFPSFETVSALCALKYKIHAVRVSNTSVRIESELDHIPLNETYSNYSTETVITDSFNTDAIFSMKRSSQVITVAALDSNVLNFELNLKTSDALNPIKVLTSKLYLLNN